MTFHVVTPEHGEHQFDADDWETLSGENGDEGNLWLSKDGVGVAEFAKGAWLFVYETKDPAPETKPRQWRGLFDVPSDVKVVKDCDGDEWTRADTAPRWGDPHHWLNDYAPFTEVL